MINLEATFLHQALPSVCTATEGVSNRHCAKAKGALGGLTCSNGVQDAVLPGGRGFRNISPRVPLS